MITIDDAPYYSRLFGSSFEDILNVLEKYDMKVIFFVISTQVNDQNRELLIRALKEGHRLENHGRVDKRHSSLSRDDLIYEIDECDKLLNGLYKEAKVQRPENKLYRPGCGTFNEMMLGICRWKKYQMILGNTYPHDPFVISPIINYLYIKYHLEENDIVIIHDRAWTPALLERLGPYLKSNNFRTVTQL